MTRLLTFTVLVRFIVTRKINKFKFIYILGLYQHKCVAQYFNFNLTLNHKMQSFKFTITSEDVEFSNWLKKYNNKKMTKIISKMFTNSNSKRQSKTGTTIITRNNKSILVSYDHSCENSDELFNALTDINIGLMVCKNTEKQIIKRGNKCIICVTNKNLSLVTDILFDSDYFFNICTDNSDKIIENISSKFSYSMFVSNGIHRKYVGQLIKKFNLGDNFDVKSKCIMWNESIGANLLNTKTTLIFDYSLVKDCIMSNKINGVKMEDGFMKVDIKTSNYELLDTLFKE